MAIKFDIKIKGLDRLEKKINTIAKNIPKIVQESVEDILKETRICAIRLEKGHNEEGIKCELVDVANNKVKGRVYADPAKFITENGQSYLWFEYFGTGQYAEQEHVGETEHFIESGYTEWYIPVLKVGRNLPYPIITIADVQFYVAHGSKANHFLSDAEFETRDANIEIVEKKLYEMLKEVCK